MDVHDVERLLGITRQSVYKHIERGNLNPTKKGGEWFFNGSEVYRFLNKREIGKARHSPTNPPATTISPQRNYSAGHLHGLLDMLRRFESRYELQQRYMPIFEFEKMLTSVFINFQHPDDKFSGNEVNEVLSYIEGRLEMEFPGEREVWQIFYNALKEAFTEPGEFYDRRSLFEDMLLDAVIELTRQHPTIS